MPTNLPPEYFEVEQKYRAAKTPEEKVAWLEELLSTIPKHKGTDKLRADLRRRLSKLKEAAETRKGAGKRVSAFHIDKEGAGQVAVIGSPNVGKSALVAALTNARPEVANYPFTTWTPTPGMMPVENIQIQLIDTPPLNREFVEPELFNLIRRADLLLLLVDLQSYPIEQLEETLAILAEHRIAPAHQRDRLPDTRRLSAIPTVLVANKCDDEHMDEDFEALRELLEEDWPMVSVSATAGRHFERLKEVVFEKLNILRVYSKPPGKEPDLNAPFVLQKGSTVADFAAKVHQDFLEGLKAARIWGSSAFDGQMVARDHLLRDGDVVELRM